MSKRYDIRQIFADMELDLIKSMRRNLAAHEAEEEKHGFKWTQWQKRKLAALTSYRKRNREIVEQRAPDMEQGLRQTLRSAFRQGAKTVADAAGKLWNRFGFGRREDTPRPVPGPPPGAKPQQPPQPGQTPSPRIPREELPEAPASNDDHFFGMNEKRLKQLTDASTGEMRAARHAMLRQMDDVYRQTIYKAQVYHNAGAASLSKAIDMATQDFLDKGINCIEYKDGRRVNVASYAEMALRTAAQRAVFAGQGAQRDQLGVRTVLVSAHNNCSPMCLPWQGKVYIDDVYSGGTAADGSYPLLSKAMAGGLFHPNCRHNMSTFFPGRSRMLAPVDDEVASANYSAEQRQRYMERQIRKYKRREAGYVDPDNQNAAKDKVKEWQTKLREHLAENEHLRRDSKREQNKLPVKKEPGNGLTKDGKPIVIDPEITKHASKGDFTNPRDPKKQAIGKFSGGGHGQENIDVLDQHGIKYNIVKEHENGVRIGNVPDHKVKSKRDGTMQSWFPQSWDARQIEAAGTFVANLNDPDQFKLVPMRDKEGNLIATFKYGHYNGVTVGVCYDAKQRRVTTIFPDETQRMIGDEDK